MAGDSPAAPTAAGAIDEEEADTAYDERRHPALVGFRLVAEEGRPSFVENHLKREVAT